MIKLAEKSGLAARIYCDREAAPPVRTGAAGIFIKAGKAGWKISQPALPAFANYLNHLNFPGEKEICFEQECSLSSFRHRRTFLAAGTPSALAFEGGIYMRSGCFRHVRLYSSGSAAKRAAGDSDISGKFDDNLVVEGLFHRPALLQRSAGINNPLVFRAPEF